MNQQGISFDDPAILVDPYPHYSRLRAESPVHWDAAEEAWLVTRYDDVVAGLRDPRLSARTDLSFVDLLPASQRRQATALRRHFEAWMLFTDPPEHTRLRALVQGPLARQAVEPARPLVERAASRILDAAAATGRIDAVGAYAVPLCLVGLAHVMGTAEDQLGDAAGWARELLEFINVELDPDQAARAATSLAELDEFVDGLRSAAGLRPDGLAALLARHLADGALTHDQAVAVVSQVYTGALGPVPMLIANALLALVAHPEELARLRQALALTGPAIEECLRYDTPFLQIPRTAAEDLRLGNVAVKAGDRIGLMLAAANHDPLAFGRPNQLDTRREHNRHLAFGLGTHYCLGAPFTRVVTGVAVRAIVARFRRIDLEDGGVERRPFFGMRGPGRLRLRVSDDTGGAP